MINVFLYCMHLLLGSVLPLSRVFDDAQPGADSTNLANAVFRAPS